MNLFTKCTACKKLVHVKSYASTRPELASSKGDNFNINCTHCASDFKTHVNDVEAHTNATILIAGVVVAIIITAILWFFIGAIGTISMTIPLLVYQAQSKATNAFNIYRVKR